MSHHFGGLEAIGNFSLTVQAGELVGLIGPNGAGKTTIFNLITGVFRIEPGRIRFQGQDISAWASPRITAAGIARTFQNIRLFKGLSVLDNVRLGAFAQHRYGLIGALGRSRAFRDEERRLSRRAWELLERFQLSRYAETPARHLTYEDQRRCEMARALISSPRLLLLDEPAAGMNHAEAEELIRIIRELKDEFQLDHHPDRAPDAGGPEPLPAGDGPGFRLHHRHRPAPGDPASPRGPGGLPGAGQLPYRRGGGVGRHSLEMRETCGLFPPFGLRETLVNVGWALPTISLKWHRLPACDLRQKNKADPMIRAWVGRIALAFAKVKATFNNDHASHPRG